MLDDVIAACWAPESSEAAVAQSSLEYHQGPQAWYPWMMAMQQELLAYPPTTEITTEEALDSSMETETSEVGFFSQEPQIDPETFSLEASVFSEEVAGQCPTEYNQEDHSWYMWMMAMQEEFPSYPLPIQTTSEDTLGAGIETEEAKVENLSPKPKINAEKLSLESLLPPPDDPPVCEAPPSVPSLESMLFGTSTPTENGSFHSKGLPLGTTGSMKEQLIALRTVAPGTIFIVRGIKALGTPVVQQLQEYFSNFGDVTSVYAPHSRVKLNRLTTYQRAPASRWRVANTGFVIMGSADSVVRVLEHGPTHSIVGVTVFVHQFHRHSGMDPNADVDEGADADDAAAEESTSASSNHDSGNEGERLASPIKFIIDEPRKIDTTLQTSCRSFGFEENQEVTSEFSEGEPARLPEVTSSTSFMHVTENNGCSKVDYGAEEVAFVCIKGEGSTTA